QVMEPVVPRRRLPAQAPVDRHPARVAPAARPGAAAVRLRPTAAPVAWAARVAAVPQPVAPEAVQTAARVAPVDRLPTARARSTCPTTWTVQPTPRRASWSLRRTVASLR